MTANQYKESWSQGAPVAVPPGLLFHAGIGKAENFFTVTVWKTREAYESFAPMFKQIMKANGFEFGEPVILPVHQYIAP